MYWGHITGGSGVWGHITMRPGILVCITQVADTREHFLDLSLLQTFKGHSQQEVKHLTRHRLSMLWCFHGDGVGAHDYTVQYTLCMAIINGLRVYTWEMERIQRHKVWHTCYQLCFSRCWNSTTVFCSTVQRLSLVGLTFWTPSQTYERQLIYWNNPREHVKVEPHRLHTR